MIHLRHFYSFCLVAAGLVGLASAQPAPGPNLWLQAGSLALADATPVASWPDSSGNGFPALQPTPANQPLFLANVLNGKPVVRFSDDGSTATANPNLDYVISSLPLNANSNNFTAFIVFRSQVVGARDTLLQPLGNGTTVLYVETNATPSTNLYSFASSKGLTGTSAYLGNQWAIAAVEQDAVAKTLRLFRDGRLDASTAIGENSLPSSGGWLFGANKPLTGNGLNGDIAEILVYDRVLSLPERRATEAYLAGKYALPLAQAVVVDHVAFHDSTHSITYSEGGDIDNGGTMFVFVRNSGTEPQTITNLLVNGISVTGIANFKWWRAWPATLPPGGLATLTVKAVGSPLAEGATVSNLVQFASGETAAATATLVTPALRIGSVIPSQDLQTIHLYLRNLDSVSYDITSVFLNSNVTAQCTFVGGTTISPNRVGIVKVAFPAPVPLLSDLHCRITATRAGGQTVTVAAPVKLIEPAFPIGTWSSSMANTASKQQFARSNQLDTVAAVPNCCQANTMAAKYHLRSVPFAFTSETNRAPDPNQVLPNLGNRTIRAWFVRDEPDINGVPSADIASHALAYAQLDATHPTYLNIAANRKFNEFGHLADVIGMDHYAMFSAPNVIPSTWVTRFGRLEEAQEYADLLKANTEPRRMWVWPQGVASTWSTQPRDWGIDLQFWMAVMGGTKGWFWFLYTEDGYDTSPAGYAVMQRVTRKFSQVRNLVLYGETIANVTSTSAKLSARSIVGEQALVVPVINLDYSVGGLWFSPSYTLNPESGTLTIPVPAWLSPVAQVYEVTENGKVPVAFTPLGSDIQINVSLGSTAATCSKVFVLGNPDTAAPAPPARLNIAETQPGNQLVLSWEEPFDDFGILGYRILSNAVPIADVRAPIFVTPPLSDAELAVGEYTVQAFDGSTNLSAASYAVRYARWDFNVDNDLEGWSLLNHLTLQSVSNGCLSVAITGIDPYMAVTAPQVNGSAFPKVQIRMRNLTSATLGQIFWTTAAEPNYDEAKSLAFSLVANDPGFSLYTLDLAARTNWNGQTITGLRLDPVAGVGSGQVWIDWIGIGNPLGANQAPSFTKGPNQSVLEDAGPQSVANWATAISPGSPAEAGQTVTFVVTNNNTPLFAVPPAVSGAGTLTYTPAPNVCGSATVSVQAKDDGGTANGGQDTSAIQTFTITVTCVNDPPSFNKGADLVLNEDAGSQTNTAWATAVSAGPANEAAQSLSFTVTNSNPGLFSQAPVVNSAGTLAFTAAPNASGSAHLGLRLLDSGGTSNGGQNASPWQTFTITVLPVNDPPVFLPGPSQFVTTNAGSQSISGWAAGISPGPPDEAAQSLTFTTTNSNPALFSVPPAISPAGTLTYAIAPGVTGGATVLVRLLDNGGTANGGRDNSAPLPFTITVTPDGNPPAGRGGPPNLILFYVDDLGYADLGVYGQNARFTNGLPAIRTPNLDRLAAEGTRLSQFYAAPSCAPSRAALMTGLHNGHSTIRANAGSVNLRREDPVIPELLRAAGYVSGMFGKWGLGEADETAQSPTAAGQVAVGDAQPLRKGFDEFYGFLSHVGAHYSYATDLLAQRGYRLWDTLGTNLVAQEVITNYTQDVFAERALQFIERHRSNRFFLYLPFTPPHANSSMNRIDAPEIEPEYFDKTWPLTEKKFASIVTRMDRHVGLLLARLVELGLDQDTVVIFTSDNGPHSAGTHDPQFFDGNGPLRDRKFTVYDGGIRVPFIARWPGRIPAGTQSSHVAACWDLLPTLCELAGVSPLPGIDGLSFAPTLLGNPAAQTLHDHLFWTDGNTGRAVRRGDWKAVRFGANPTELYNLAVDIGEATNVAAANPAVVAQLEALLASADTAPWIPAPPVLGVNPAGPLDFGAVRLGDPPVTLSFSVSNAATGYAGLLGGTVTPVLSDPRLTAVPGIYGPLVAGATSAVFSVSFAPASVAPLAGQSISVSGALFGFGSPAATNSPWLLPITGSLLPPASRPIRSIQRQPEGARLEIEGVSGLSYSVLASTNLQHWESIGSGLPGETGWFLFIDTNAALWPRRFYRSAWP